MVIFDGASMAHVRWLDFWPLFGLSLALPARWALKLLRSFLGS